MISTFSHRIEKDTQVFSSTTKEKRHKQIIPSYLLKEAEILHMQFIWDRDAFPS